MNESQPRVITGQPGAGQWKSPQHAEAQVQLFDRMDGSFFHPSPFRTAESCIRFWSSIEVPDAIIDQFAEDFHDGQSKKVDEEMYRYMHAWEADWLTRHPKPSPAEVPAWESRYAAEREDYRLSILPGVEESYPSKIGEYDVAQMIRATQMWAHAPNPRFEGEQEKVGAHLIELFDGSMTVDEIEAKYGFSRFQESLKRVRVNDPTDKLMQVLDRIDAGNQQLAEGIAESLRAGQEEHQY